MPVVGQPMRDRRAPGPAWAAAVVLSTAVVPLVTAAGTVVMRSTSHPGTAPERSMHPAVLALVLAGLAAGPAAAWAVRRDHPHAAVGLATATVALALPVWAGWPALPPVAAAAALAAAPLAVPALAQVALAWRGGASRGAHVAAWGCAAVAALVHLLGYDPFADPQCARTCAAVQPVLEGVLPTTASVGTSAAAVVSAAAVATAAVVDRGTGIPSPVRAAVGGSLVALAGASVVRAAAWGGAEAAGSSVVLAPLTVGTTATAVAVVASRTARTRAAVDEVLRQLADPRHASGRAGPVRDVHFAVPGEDRWVAATGAEPPVAGTDVRSVVLPDHAGPAVRLLLDARADEVEVLSGLTPARRLALANVRLTAVARARLLDLRSSQRRVVANGDAERIRIERDVHDGAQQRLVSAMFQLSLAQAHATGPARTRLAAARAEVGQTLDRLRHITRGPFPRVLADEGLAAAVEDLVLDADVPVRLQTAGDLRVGPEAGRAAYAVVAAGLAEQRPGAAAPSTRVGLVRADGLLHVAVEICPPPDEGTDAADIADRVGAVGGTYDRTRTAGSLVVTAVIPCGS